MKVQNLLIGVFGICLLIIGGAIAFKLGQQTPLISTQPSPTPTSTSTSSPTPTSSSTPTSTPTASPSSSPTTNPSLQPSVNITSPKEGQSVPNGVALEGTIENLPKNEELWIVIRIGNIYYPQRGSVSINGNQWSGTGYVGRSGSGADTGRKFTILIVAASKETGEKYTKYLNEADAKGSYPGIPKLFGGKPIKSITVIRDDSAANK
jgi:hypothetical protein